MLFSKRKTEGTFEAIRPLMSLMRRGPELTVLLLLIFVGIPVVLFWSYILAKTLLALWSVVKQLFRSFRDNWHDVSTRPVRREEIPLLSGSIQESYKIGSSPFKSLWPDVQAIVYVDDGTGYVANGCAWRWKDCLITAAHVLEGNYSRYGVGLPEGPIFEFSIAEARCEDDLAAVPVSANMLSRVGLKAATLDNVPDLFVRITGPMQPGTTIGMLKPTNIFGILEYTGTTFPGYSGAPYIASARTVVAMHLSGGTSNLCYASAYIQMKLNRMFKTKQEVVDSDSSVIPEKKKGKTKKGRGNLKKKRKSSDWYSEELGPDTKVKAKRRGNDYVEVEVNGKYYNMDEDEYSRFYQHARNRKVAMHHDDAPAPKAYKMVSSGKGFRVEKAAQSKSSSSDDSGDEESTTGDFLGKSSDMRDMKSHSLELHVLMNQISESLKSLTSSPSLESLKSSKFPETSSGKSLDSPIPKESETVSNSGLKKLKARIRKLEEELSQKKEAHS